MTRKLAEAMSKRYPESDLFLDLDQFQQISYVKSARFFFPYNYAIIA